MRGSTQSNSEYKIKKEKDKRAVRDDFYDRINYYESRNIFSSNEPFNPSNRLYTDHASLSHPVWNAIKQTNENFREIKNEISIDKKQDSSFDKELTQNLLSSINKLNTTSSSSSIGCKKCGYVGHLSYQCRNNFKLKNPSKIEITKTPTNLINPIKETNEEKPLEKEKKKKHKKDKDKKKDKKRKNERSRSTSKRREKKEKQRIRDKSRSISSRPRTPPKERKEAYKERKDKEKIRNRSKSRSRSRSRSENSHIRRYKYSK